MAGKIDEMHPRFLEDLGDAVINKIGRKRWRRLKYFFIAIPFLIFIIAFSYVPLLGWVYAFCDYKIGQPWNTFNWVGLKHFQRFFTDSSVFRVLRNTLVMSLLQILVLPLPAVFAIMFNDIRSLKAKKLIQTATTLPYFISWIIVFGLAQGFFSANGLVNQLIKLFGGTPSPFGLIGDLDATWIFQLCLSVWKTLGWNTILYMAAIAGIDQELYDAAKVDGANKLQTIRHITIPGIMPTYMVLLLLKVSNLLNQGFDQYYQFYNSLVADKVEVLEYYIYRIGFFENQYSFGIAVGVLQSLVAIILLFIANTISRRIRGTSIV